MKYEVKVSVMLSDGKVIETKQVADGFLDAQGIIRKFIAPYGLRNVSQAHTSIVRVE